MAGVCRGLSPPQGHHCVAMTGLQQPAFHECRRCFVGIWVTLPVLGYISHSEEGWLSRPCWHSETQGKQGVSNRETQVPASTGQPSVHVQTWTAFGPHPLFKVVSSGEKERSTLPLFFLLALETSPSLLQVHCYRKPVCLFLSVVELVVFLPFSAHIMLWAKFFKEEKDVGRLSKT